MAVFFVFLRNIHSSIEILKIKILEYSYPPSQYFFVPKAFIRFFSCRRKVALYQSGRMAHQTVKCGQYLDNHVFILVSKQTNAILPNQNRDEKANLRKKL